MIELVGIESAGTEVTGIEIAGHVIALGDPRLWAGVGALVVLAVLLAILRAARRAAGRAEAMAARVGLLAEGQHQLAGGLAQLSEAQAAAQTRVLGLMEHRLSEVARGMGENLQGSALRTARSLGELRERLEVIDRAQARIEELSGNVLGLQDILSNKQTRGAFGEIQLHDIVQKALPADGFTMQATLSNGRRADCLVHLPDPPGPIVIDSKFPLEAYEALVRAPHDAARIEAQRRLRIAIRSHIRAISEKYILEGETADGALMFLPSEAVYAELHANFPELVREGFAARVWIVSPTTCMATLNTMRAILKDARMRAQAGAIRAELAALCADVDRLMTRVENLDRHFGQAARDIEEIRTSAGRAGKRARRLDNFDFEDLPPESGGVAGKASPQASSRAQAGTGGAGPCEEAAASAADDAKTAPRRPAVIRPEGRPLS
ncbi:DNA recombination protein RmuC [Phaeovulum vinaykumarii]